MEEVVRARYDSARFPHAFSVSPRLISNWLVHFPAAMEEVTMMAGPECLNGDGKGGGIAETASTGDAGWIRFRSFVEGGGSAGGHGSATADRHALSTEVQLDPGEFDTFAVRQATDLTFNMKEFKVTNCKAVHLFPCLQTPLCSPRKQGRTLFCRRVRCSAPCPL